MAEADHPELQAQLHELDQELEDGDITKKGYEKRRTQILSTFLSPRELDALQGTGLRVHNADDTSHPSRPEGHSRAESFASISAGPYAQEQRYEGGGDGSWGEPLAARDEYTLGGGSPAGWQIQPPTPGSYDPGPPSQVQRHPDEDPVDKCAPTPHGPSIRKSEALPNCLIGPCSTRSPPNSW